ncbi:hypothetical protein [Bacillus vallismortis]|uniref:hypothetical protein n=1 Tax=Bacillus vallismortis TaxID=72361 RepID=UPI00228258F8|nr:hypothetical protein [Bacillus vallismortis]MCY7917140.1 hypothetical protein [Bacillus vallismortis]
MESNIKRGLIIGFIGVVCFSSPLPATSTAVPYFGETIVRLCRTAEGCKRGFVSMIGWYYK